MHIYIYNTRNSNETGRPMSTSTHMRSGTNGWGDHALPQRIRISYIYIYIYIYVYRYIYIYREREREKNIDIDHIYIYILQ